VRFKAYVVILNWVDRVLRYNRTWFQQSSRQNLEQQLAAFLDREWRVLTSVWRPSLSQPTRDRPTRRRTEQRGEGGT